MDTKIEDKKLIESYLKGDEKSLELLISKYLKPMYGFLYKNVGDLAVAEDLSQEVFLKVWKNMKKFDTSKSFKPWLFQIAKNTSIDYLRKKKSIPFSRFENEKGQNLFIENITSPKASFVEALDNKRVLATLTEGLNPRDMKIINLKHEYGMTFKEIAETFKESINTTKSKYRRIIRVLRSKAQYQS